MGDQRNCDFELDLSDIYIPGERRKVNPEKVRALAASIQKDGLQYPITVLRCIGLAAKKYELVAGLHRLKAFRLLGRASIPARLIDEEHAPAWAAAENLMRNELLPLERSEELVRYVRATLPFVRPGRGGNQPHDLGVSRVAKELCIDRRIVREALLHSALSRSVKSLLVKNKLHLSSSFLTKIAKMANERAQLNAIERILADRHAPALDEKDAGKPNKAPLSEGYLPQLARLENAWKTSEVAKIFRASERKVQRGFLDKL